MSDDLTDLLAETEAALAAAADLRALDAVRVGVLGKSGSVTALLKGLGAIPADQRKERGAAVNRLKGALEAAITSRHAVLEEAALDARLKAERLDVSRQSINAIETGKYDPSLPLAFKIAHIFAAAIESIFIPDEESTAP